MNFLAHLWLADRTRTSLAGAVLGDVARGADLSAYPDAVALGIRLHRRVDAATDRHPHIADARADFAPGARRYAGIVLDLAADHALAARWADFHDEPLEAFAQRCGVAMARAADWFELAGGRRPTAAGFSALLLSYAAEPGIEHALQRTATRLRDPQALLAAAQGWPQRADALQARLPALLDHLLETMRREIATRG